MANCLVLRLSTSMCSLPSTAIYLFKIKIIDLPLAVIVLAAPTNRLADLRALLPRLLPAIELTAIGQVVLIS